MSLNQSGVGSAKNSAMISLCWATGQTGRPGAAPFSHRPAQRHDGSEAGSLSNPLPGHVKPPVPNTEVAAHGNGEQFSARSAIEQFDTMRNGRPKALWGARTKQAQSPPDQTHVREALAAAH